MAFAMDAYLQEIAAPGRVAVAIGAVLLATVGFLARGWWSYVNGELKKKATATDLARLEVEVNALRAKAHDMSNVVTGHEGDLDALRERVERLEADFRAMEDRLLSALQRDAWGKK